MKIKVGFFAMCREITGRESQTIPLPDHATGEHFWKAVLTLYPELAPYKRLSRLAVNLEYVNHDIALSDGDEVCIIPPVSGG